MQTLILKYLTQQLESALKYHEVLLDDPENLHQFRVALRRMRSLIKLYMPDAYAFSEVLKQIFRQTNALRELDVLLLSLNKKHYPKLHKYIRKHANEQYRILLTPEVLNDQKHSLERLQSELIYFYTSDPVISLYDPAYTLYTRTLHTYKKSRQNATAKQLHQVRIDFKTSRYALDFLHEEGMYYMANELKQCKKVLDDLGRLQDGRNQIALIKGICRHYKDKGCTRLLQERKRSFKQFKRSLTN